MTVYTSITVIYNPKSTGSGKQLSNDFEKDLTAKLPHIPITIRATKRPGHAHEIAKQASLDTPRPLIISASGDGGYNEVINGVMEAIHQHPNIIPTTGLLAAGNANDHFNALHQEDILHLIQHNREQTIDLLQLSITSFKKTSTRYAHSYIGLGLSPQVGLELNKTDLNKLNELVISIRTLLFLRPVRIRVDRNIHRYSSLIFSNIDRMAKYLTLSKNSSITDGKFEVISFGVVNRFKLLATILKASTLGLDGHQKASQFVFTTLSFTKIQIDGEVIKVPANAEVTIKSRRQSLRCIV